MSDERPKGPRSYPLYFGLGGALLLGGGVWVALIGLVLFLLK